MKRSDEILQRAFKENRGLTKSERYELREAYLHEQAQRQTIRFDKNTILGKEDMMNLPRHQMAYKCADFHECPLCYKCRNFNPRYAKCMSCQLYKEGKICKTSLHTERAIEMMIVRERIDLDAEKE
jgi:hypothetical protein